MRTEAELIASTSELLASRLGAQRVWIVSAQTAREVLCALREDAEVQEVFSLGGSPLSVEDVRSRAKELRAKRQASYKAALRAWGSRRKELGPEGVKLPKPQPQGPYLLCNNTWATSGLCAAVQLGADIVVESLQHTLSSARFFAECRTSSVKANSPQDMSLNELADAWPVAVGFSKDALSHWEAAKQQSRVLSEGQQHFLMHTTGEVSLCLHVALANLDEWIQAASSAAQAVASYVRCHPGVRAVHYPGLVQDASFERAASILHDGFGAFLDIDLAVQDSKELVEILNNTPQFLELGAFAWIVDAKERRVRLKVTPDSDLQICNCLETALAK